MTSKATEYRTAHATPSALFEIELWRAAIIVALRQPQMLAVPLHMFIRNPRDRKPYPTVSDANPWRLCAELYSAVTGEVLAWVTYRLPSEKDFVCKSQGHREYLGHRLSILLLVEYSKVHPDYALQYKGALAWAEKNRSPASMRVWQLANCICRTTSTWALRFTAPVSIWVKSTQ